MKTTYVLAIALNSENPTDTTTRESTVVANTIADAVRQFAAQVETNEALMQEIPGADTLVIAAIPSQLAEELVRRMLN